jgi:hypothetical protein
MRLFVKSIVAIVLLALLPILVHAEPVAQLRPTDYVNDFGHVLDQNIIVQLDDICRQVEQKARAQIAVVTVNSLDGSDIDSYAVDLFKKWGIGSKTTDHGVLILLAVQDRKYRIEVGYGLEPILPDGKVGSGSPFPARRLQRRDFADDDAGRRRYRQGCRSYPDRAPSGDRGTASRTTGASHIAGRFGPAGDHRSAGALHSAAAGSVLAAAFWRRRWRRRPRRLGRLQRWRRFRRRWRRLRRLWRRQFRWRRCQRRLVTAAFLLHQAKPCV